MNVDAKIQAIELKTVALAKAQSELNAELEKVKKHAANPVPQIRKKLKDLRLQEVENFYTKRKLNRSSC